MKERSVSQCLVQPANIIHTTQEEINNILKPKDKHGSSHTGNQNNIAE